MNDTPEVEAVYTSDEAAAILQVDRRTISKLVRRGVLQVLPHIRHHRIPVSSVAAYLATAKGTATGTPVPSRAAEPSPAVRPADTARAAIAAARAGNKADAWRQEVLGFLNAHPGWAYYLNELRRAITSPLPADPHALPAQLEAWASDETIGVDGMGPCRAYKSASPAPARGGAR